MEARSSDWRPGPTVCRCCLSEGCYKDISTEYFWMGRREVYSEMLSETLNLSIAYSNSSGPNSNSRLICEQCISRLRDASEFKRQVVDCEKTFMQHLNPGSSSKSRDFPAVDSIGDVKVEVVKHEKESLSDDDFDDRPDFLDVDSDDDLDDQPLTKLASKIPKKEVDILDLLDNSQITVKRKSNLKTKEPPKKVLKKKETKATRTVSKATPKQAEKKKDEEWTTTDVREEIPVEFDKNTDLSCLDDEWTTTDVREEVPVEFNKITDFSFVEEEWVTTDVREAIPVEFNKSIGANNEWITTNLADHAVDNEWIKLSLNSAENPVKPYYCLDEYGSQWVITDTVKNTVYTVPNCPDFIKRSRIRAQLQTNMEGFVSTPILNETRFDEPVSKLKRTKRQNQNNVEGQQLIPKPAPIDSRVDPSKWERVPIRGVGEMLLKVPKSPKALLDTTTLSKEDLNAVLLLRNTTAIPYRIENLRSIIPCFACTCKFLDPFLFRDHFIAEHQSVDKANGIFSKTIKTRADITDLSCLLCTQPLDNLDNAAAHLVQEHQIGIDLNEKLGLVPLKFLERGLCQCAVCGKKVVTFRELYRHSGSHFAYQICEVCGMRFESPEVLKMHAQRKHIKGRLCVKCKVIFPSDKELKQHIKEVPACNSGYCKICDKAFGYWTQLQKHREAVHGYEKKVYSCSVCEKVFEKRMQLYFHFKQKHTDVYKCKICNKKVCGPTGLKKHMRTHSGSLS